MNLFDFIYEKIWFPKEHKIRFFEAFSGIGCQLMALKRITDNFEVVGISEIDKYALQSYMAIHGEVKNYGGIGSFERLPKDVDICTWSFPCTDISLAGQQKGMVDGTRSNYGYEFLNTVDRTPKGERPKVLIMENVKALFSDKFKEDWREIQRRLDKLGYMSYAQVLNGKDYGVAQNRERIFIVSVMGEYNYVFPEPKPLTKRLKDYLEDKVDDKYYLSDKALLGVVQKEMIQTIKTMPNDVGVVVKTSNEETKVYKTREDDMPRHRIYTDDSVGFTITTNESQMPSIVEEQPSILQKARGNNKGGLHEISPTITSNAFQENNHLVNGLKIRKLTPRECWRLMGISDEDFDKAQASGMSNAQLYKQAGNGIIVDVFEAILSQMIEREIK